MFRGYSFRGLTHKQEKVNHVKPLWPKGHRCSVTKHINYSEDCEIWEDKREGTDKMVRKSKLHRRSPIQRTPTKTWRVLIILRNRDHLNLSLRLDQLKIETPRIVKWIVETRNHSPLLELMSCPNGTSNLHQDTQYRSRIVHEGRTNKEEVKRSDLFSYFLRYDPHSLLGLTLNRTPNSSPCSITKDLRTRTIRTKRVIRPDLLKRTKSRPITRSSSFYNVSFQ